MSGAFFEQPVVDSPYEHPARHWELDPEGQPTSRIVEQRRRAEFITPIPKSRKRKTAAAQDALEFGDRTGASTKAQRYDPTPTSSSGTCTGWRRTSGRRWRRRSTD